MQVLARGAALLLPKGPCGQRGVVRGRGERFIPQAPGGSIKWLRSEQCGGFLMGMSAAEDVTVQPQCKPLPWRELLRALNPTQGLIGVAECLLYTGPGRAQGGLFASGGTARGP